MLMDLLMEKACCALAVAEFIQGLAKGEHQMIFPRPAGDPCLLAISPRPAGQNKSPRPAVEQNLKDLLVKKMSRVVVVAERHERLVEVKLQGVSLRPDGEIFPLDLLVIFPRPSSEILPPRPAGAKN